MQLLSLALQKAFPGSRTLAEPVVYPYVDIQSGMPGTFVEHLYAPFFVFFDNALQKISISRVPSRPLESTYRLASYGDSTRHITLCFRPKTDEIPVAALLLRDNFSLRYEYELPELGDRANYRQVCGLPQYTFLRNNLKNPSKRTNQASAMPGWGVGLLVGLGLLTCMLLFTPSSVSQSGQGASAQSANALNSVKPALTPVPAAALSVGDQLNESEKATLARVVSTSGIELSLGDKPFVIFSDPHCPACKELEARLAELKKTDPSLSPVVVPVSFKAGSKESVEGVLCSLDAPTAWRAAMGGGDALPTCTKGQEQAQTNNAAFAALRFDRTPTIVTSTGKVAVGAKDFDGLVKWIKENSGN